MKSVESALSTHLDSEVTALCTCWEITRRDGVVLRFTDSDEPVVVEGLTYKSYGAYQRTAIENTATLSVDNLDVEGITGDLTLPIAELRSGVYDGAEVKVFLTSWVPSIAGKLRLRRGFFGEVQVMSNGSYKVELRGLLQRLAHTYNDIYTPTCGLDLGDYDPVSKPHGCRIVIMPEISDDGSGIASGLAYRQPQPGFIVGTTHDFPLGDNTFAEIGANSVATSRYWTGNAVAANDATAPNGTNVVVGAAGGSTLVQVIDITGITGITDADIDAGDVYVNLFAWLLGGATVRYRFRDAAYAQSAIAFTSAAGGGSWTLASDRNRVIAATHRFLEIEIVLPDASAKCDSVFGWFTNAAVPGYPPEVFDNKYQVKGGATNVNAWLRSAIITHGGDARTFRIAVSEPRAVDGWFATGVVTFHSGKNAGASVEVKGWTQIDSEVELYLSLPYPVSAGDQLSIYPGCDKTRLCCSFFFDNIEDFSGQPDVPGEDNILRYPDAK